MKWKPDFDLTAQRFEAWWQCEIIDRPPVSLSVEPSRPYTGPISRHATAKERWLDVEFNVTRQIADLGRCDWVGDAFPVVVPNVGPEVTAALYGADMDYLDDRTGWSEPIIHDAAGWDALLQREADFDNPYWRAVEAMTALAIDMAGGRYAVGMTDLHGNYDILAALREPQALCVDMLDCPEQVRAAGRHVARGYVEAFERNWALVRDAGFGSATWTRLYHDGPAYLPSCDFWCMLSHDMAREFVLPAIISEMKPLARSLFHLDGPQALPHLDLLLDLPQLTGVQWVYGAGGGQAAVWIDMYRRILNAGKCAQVIAQDGADALAVLEAVGPRGVWLLVREPFDSVASAEAFLHDVKRCNMVKG